MFKCCTKGNPGDSEESPSDESPAPTLPPPVNDPPTRKPSVGILKKKTSFCEENKIIVIDREEEKKALNLSVDCELANKDTDITEPEPPRTPVGKDELALRRHRFFSELLTAAQSAIEHKVRFDPLGPEVADLGTHWVLCSLPPFLCVEACLWFNTFVFCVGMMTSRYIQDWC